MISKVIIVKLRKNDPDYFLIYFFPLVEGVLKNWGTSVKQNIQVARNKEETFPSVSCDLPKMGYLIEKKAKINQRICEKHNDW